MISLPRGNDKESALHELADKFGQGVGNADNLIEANMAMHTQALHRAELLPRDPEKTAKVREDLGKLKAPEGGKVVDAAVRGGTTVLVYEDETGRQHLAVADDDDDQDEPRTWGGMQNLEAGAGPHGPQKDEKKKDEKDEKDED